MRILFFGTPAFAVPSLRALLGAGHEVVAVVTQPDRPHGRSRSVVVAPPVKVAAVEAGLLVLQPDKPVGIQLIDQLSALRADLGVVVAYGHILRPQVLAIPRLGMINVHASLLPRWRGAAPIQWAIRSGDRTTGVTIMQMEAGLDSGPAWHARATPIGPGETGGTLTERLSLLGAEALLEALPRLIGGAAPVAQDDQRRHPRAQDRPRHCPHRLERRRRAAGAPRGGVRPGAGRVDDARRRGREDVWRRAQRREARRRARGRGARRMVLLAPTTCSRSRPATAASLVREVQPAGKKRQPVAEWVRGAASRRERDSHEPAHECTRSPTRGCWHCPGFLDVARRIATQGARVAIHLRDRTASGRALADHAVALRDTLAGTGTALIVNARPDIAAAVAAQGVQLGAGRPRGRRCAARVPGLLGRVLGAQRGRGAGRGARGRRLPDRGHHVRERVARRARAAGHRVHRRGRGDGSAGDRDRRRDARSARPRCMPPARTASRPFAASGARATRRSAVALMLAPWEAS